MEENNQGITNEVKQEELFIPKTKHKALKIIIGVILLAGLAVGGYFLYQKKFNNPNTIVSNVLEDAKADIKNTLTEKVSGKKYKYDGYIKVDSNINQEGAKVFELLKNLQMQFNGEVDMDNSIGNISINTKYKNDKLIDMKTYYEKDTVYLLLEGIYDKYIKTKADDSNSISEIVPEFDIDTKDMQALSEALLTSLKDEVGKLDLKKENEKITIGDKEVSVINNYVELKNGEMNKFIKSFATSLKSNKEFIAALKKLGTDDPDELLEQISSSFGGEAFQGTYKICFYTDTGIFDKKLVSIRQTITQSGISISLNYDKISDDEMELSLSAMGAVISFRIKKNNSAINLIVSESMMGIYIKAELNFNYEQISEITKPDVSNSKDADDLTEAEVKEIENKLNSNKTLMGLIDELQSMVPQVNLDA